MSYDYSKERETLFTDQGQIEFLAVRDHVAKLVEASGVVRMDKAMMCRGAPADSWRAMACVDRLVEIGELRELPTSGVGQWRVFVRAE